MTRLVFLLAVMAGVALAAGCKDEHRHEQNGGQAPGAAEMAKDADVHEGEGPAQELGTQPIGGYSVKAAQLGSIKAGDEGAFELEVSGGAGQPKAIRAWVGTEDGLTSTKTRAEAEDEGEYHLHVDVPTPLPAGSRLWVEVETDAGSEKGSFEVKQ